MCFGTPSLNLKGRFFQLSTALLYRHGFRQITRFINIQTAGDRSVVCQQLQRDHCKGTDEVLIDLRDIDGEIDRILDAVISIAGKPHQISSPCFAFRHVAECFFDQLPLGQNADHESVLFNTADRPVL